MNLHLDVRMYFREKRVEVGASQRTEHALHRFHVTLLQRFHDGRMILVPKRVVHPSGEPVQITWLQSHLGTLSVLMNARKDIRITLCGNPAGERIWR
jgi:aromatic ring-cleaving dioxygenase